MGDNFIFLTWEQVLDLHRCGLERFGGAEGFIDENVARSAAAQPGATMFGQYLHGDISLMAAAYLFHFAASQGFADGNKRTGVACAITFLKMNGYNLAISDEELYDSTILIATHRLTKEQAADVIRDHLLPLT